MAPVHTNVWSFNEREITMQVSDDGGANETQHRGFSSFYEHDKAREKDKPHRREELRQSSCDAQHVSLLSDAGQPL